MRPDKAQTRDVASSRGIEKESEDEGEKIREKELKYL